jgi:hypothetical protein
MLGSNHFFGRENRRAKKIDLGVLNIVCLIHLRFFRHSHVAFFGPSGKEQTAPLDRLVSNQVCYSFDLKSATDRWPLVFLFEVFKYLFDREFASAVVNSALACNVFLVPWVKLTLV